MSNSEQTTKAKQTAEKPKLTQEQREAQRKQALDDAAKKAVPSRSTPAIIVFFLPNFDEMKPIGIYETTATPVAIMSVVL